MENTETNNKKAASSPETQRKNACLTLQKASKAFYEFSRELSQWSEINRKDFLNFYLKTQELYDIVTSFSNIEEVRSAIDWLQCFRFALEQYGVENPAKFVKH